MSTEINYKGEKILLIKGASEYIMGSCSHIHYWDTDEILPMTEDLKTQIKDAIHGMAKKTLRTLCLAYKKIDEE
jgi:Ca2+ transporting ATPase